MLSRHKLDNNAVNAVLPLILDLLFQAFIHALPVLEIRGRQAELSCT